MSFARAQARYDRAEPPEHDEAECPDCYGLGEYEAHPSDPAWTTCSRCRGRGVVDVETVPDADQQTFDARARMWLEFLRARLAQAEAVEECAHAQLRAARALKGVDEEAP